MLTKINQDPVNGAQQAGSWAVRETFAAVIVGNVPMIYPLLLRGFQTVDNSLASHYGRRAKYSANSGYSSGSYAMHDRKEKKNYIHPLSMRNVTAGGDSAESIVRAEQRVKDGRDISIVKEATVVVTDERSSHEEDIFAYPGSSSQRVPTGYAVTCNHAASDRHSGHSRRQGS